jgi:hypothetical protein
MNPQSSEHNGLDLPPPVTEQAPSSTGSIENPLAPIETGSSGVESATGTAQSAAPAPITIPLPMTPSATPGPVDLPTVPPPQSGVQAAADDSDLIEKEWVNKAKQIVERTREDPREQSKELTVFKADYMQKRYNKTIKLSE